MVGCYGYLVLVLLLVACLSSGACSGFRCFAGVVGDCWFGYLRRLVDCLIRWVCGWLCYAWLLITFLCRLMLMFGVV